MNSFSVTSDDRLIAWSVEDFLPSHVYSDDIRTINNYSPPSLNVFIPAFCPPTVPHTHVLSFLSISCMSLHVFCMPFSCMSGKMCKGISVSVPLHTAVNDICCNDVETSFLCHSYYWAMLRLSANCILLVMHASVLKLLLVETWEHTCTLRRTPTGSALCSSSALQCFCALHSN